MNPSRMGRTLDITFLTLLAIGTVGATARVGLTPRQPLEGVAVIFSPWTSADSALQGAVDAGSRFVRFGALPFIAVVMPDDSGYPARAFAAGAWLVADPRVLSYCLADLSQKSRQ